MLLPTTDESLVKNPDTLTKFTYSERQLEFIATHQRGVLPVNASQADNVDTSAFSSKHFDLQCVSAFNDDGSKALILRPKTRHGHALLREGRINHLMSKYNVSLHDARKIQDIARYVSCGLEEKVQNFAVTLLKEYHNLLPSTERDIRKIENGYCHFWRFADGYLQSLILEGRKDLPISPKRQKSGLLIACIMRAQTDNSRQEGKA